MNKLALALLLSTTASSAAYATTIDFDTLSVGATVDQYYNGGMDSAAETGPAVGVEFQTSDWIVQTGFGETSKPNFAYSGSGVGMVNVAGGFTGSLSFTYGAFTNFTLSIFDGVNGTGSVLATTVLGADDVSAFSPFSISFAGTARSFGVVGNPEQFGFDDVQIGGAVPEPGTWALMIGGFGVVGGALRRRNVRALTA